MCRIDSCTNSKNTQNKHFQNKSQKSHTHRSCHWIKIQRKRVRAIFIVWHNAIVVSCRRYDMVDQRHHDACFWRQQSENTISQLLTFLIHSFWKGETHSYLKHIFLHAINTRIFFNIEHILLYKGADGMAWIT